MFALFRNKMFMFDEIVKWNNASKFAIILQKDPNCVFYYKTKLAQKQKKVIGFSFSKKNCKFFVFRTISSSINLAISEEC